MKSLFVKYMLAVMVMGAVSGAVSAKAAEWKEFAEATTGIFYYDAASIRSTPEGFIRVWIHNQTRRETNLVEFNCKAKTYHVIDVVEYDETGRIRSRETYYGNPDPTWYPIAPKSVPEPLYMIVCP